MLHTTTSKLLICLATLFIPHLGNAQTLFQKTYNLNNHSDNGLQMSTTSTAKISDNQFLISGYGQFSGTEVGPYQMSLDSTGTLLWAKTYGNSTLNGGELTSTLYTSDQNIISIGKIFNGVSQVGYVNKTKPNGELIWSKTIGDAGISTNLYGIIEDSEGNIYVSGYNEFVDNLDNHRFSGLIFQLNLNGDLLWKKEYERSNVQYLSFYDFKIHSSGKILVVGSTAKTGSPDDQKGFVLEINSSGIPQNCTVLSSPLDYNGLGSIIELPNTNLLLGGNINDYEYIASMDLSGTIQWSKRNNLFQTYHYSTKLSPDNQSFYLVNQHTYEYPNRQATLSKFSLDGNLLWSKEYGYCNEDVLYDFHFGANHTISLFGVTRSYGIGEQTNLFYVRADTSGYTSCMDDKGKSNYETTPITTENVVVLSNNSPLIFTNYNTFTNDIAVKDTLICSSLNPVGVKFKASDTIVCAGSCISFQNESTYHLTLDSMVGDMWGNDLYDMTPSYKWLFESGSGEDLVENPSEVCYDTPGTFAVSLIVTQGCKIDTLTKKDYITVIPANSKISITGDSSVCSGNPATLTASGAGSYTWSPATGLNTTTGETVIANPSTTTTYTVTGTAGTCVIEPKTVTVTINSTPDVSISSASPLLICAGESKTVTATGASSYTWSPATGLSSTNNASVTASPTEDITYKVVGANGSCKDSAEISVLVEAAPVVEPIADITMSWGNSTTLSVIGGEKYSWSPAEGLSCSDCANPIATPTTNTTYCVTVSDSSTCTTSECLTIYLTLDCGQVFVPTSFSPNGDNLNDLLEVKMNPACIENFEFILFDRWGEKVFESSKITNSWDGKFNGKELDNAVFVYQLKMKLVNETTETIKKGNVTIIK